MVAGGRLVGLARAGAASQAGSDGGRTDKQEEIPPLDRHPDTLPRVRRVSHPTWPRPSDDGRQADPAFVGSGVLVIAAARPWRRVAEGRDQYLVGFGELKGVLQGAPGSFRVAEHLARDQAQQERRCDPDPSRPGDRGRRRCRRAGPPAPSITCSSRAIFPMMFLLGFGSPACLLGLDEGTVCGAGTYGGTVQGPGGGSGMAAVISTLSVTAAALSPQ